MRTVILALSVLAGLLPGGIAFAQPGAIVGEATLVIGVGRAINADGVAQPLSKGMPVKVGDRIETEAGGHVHIRFVDGARLSVRPSSRLSVEDYRYDPQQSSQSAIKFRLDEGVVRSITGTWGEAARDRFRLNTPIAAIGIKGTDFVVRTEAERTFASVFAGAIVFAPLDAACRGTLGPCQNGREQVLSAEMQGQMLELNRQRERPQLVPAVDLMVRNERNAPVRLAGTAETRADYLEKVTANEARTTDVITSTATSPAVTQATTPSAPQLGWVRWNWATPMSGDAFSQAFEAALQKGWEASIGNGAYALFRQPVAQMTVAPGITSVDFKLANAAAQFQRNDQRFPEAAQVNGGTLNVDFVRSNFTTTLNVSNPSIGADTLNASGAVRSNGVFLGTGNGFVAGALSGDGRQAGYLFEKSFSQGQLSGVTLWGR